MLALFTIKEADIMELELINQVPPSEPPKSPVVPSHQREGKELDELYSAACCALLHQVGLSHFWDGQPHGPGRAWQLPRDQRLSDEQRLVVRVALDIWDNEGGVLLRDLRQLPPGLITMVGELIAATSGRVAMSLWVERYLGDGWRHWMAETRWVELLGLNWRASVEGMNRQSR